MFICSGRLACNDKRLVKLNIAKCCLLYIGITTYMFIRSPKLAACVVSVIPIVAVANKKYGDWLRLSATQVQDALAEANTSALEAMSCIKTVFSLSSEEFEKGRYHQAIEKLYRSSLQQVSDILPSI